MCHWPAAAAPAAPAAAAAAAIAAAWLLCAAAAARRSLMTRRLVPHKLSRVTCRLKNTPLFRWIVCPQTFCSRCWLIENLYSKPARTEGLNWDQVCRS